MGKWAHEHPEQQGSKAAAGTAFQGMGAVFTGIMKRQLSFHCIMTAKPEEGIQPESKVQVNVLWVWLDTKPPQVRW